MYYYIDYNKLKKADIILTKNKTKKSKIIRKATFSNYSHSILYLGSSSYIEADGNGVHVRNLGRLSFKNLDNFLVLRYNGLSNEVRDRICYLAKEVYGAEYNKINAIKSAINKNKKENGKNYNGEFCSKLVAKAYEKAEKRLFDDLSFENVHPGNIEDCVNLKKIKDVHYCLEKDLSKKESPLELQKDVTNKFINSVKPKYLKYHKRVNNFNEALMDFYKLNLGKKEFEKFDSFIAQKLKESGYLKLWKEEQRINSTSYSLEELKKFYDNLTKKEQEIIFNERKKNNLENYKRYIKQYEQFILIKKRRNSITIELLIELYENLYKNSLERIELNKKAME